MCTAPTQENGFRGSGISFLMVFPWFVLFLYVFIDSFQNQFQKACSFVFNPCWKCFGFRRLPKCHRKWMWKMVSKFYEEARDELGHSEPWPPSAWPPLPSLPSPCLPLPFRFSFLLPSKNHDFSASHQNIKIRTLVRPRFDFGVKSMNVEIHCCIVFSICSKMSQNTFGVDSSTHPTVLCQNTSNCPIQMA